MNARKVVFNEELEALERRADQACSIHALLRDRYEFRAKLLDYSLMATATYLIGVSFVEPVVGWSISFGVDQNVLISALALLTFFLSIIQFKSDWKIKSQQHAIASSENASIKSKCKAVTRGLRPATGPELQRIRERYDLIADIGTHVPESQFIRAKAMHVRKVYISRYLDSHPGVWLPMLAAKLFVRDNLGIDLLNSNESKPGNQQGC